MIYEPCSVKSGFHAFAKSIDPRQPAQWIKIKGLIYTCSAECRNPGNSGIVLLKVGIPTLSADSRIVPDSSKDCPRDICRIICTVKTIDCHFVLIPSLRWDISGIEPCQVGIPTAPDKVRIPTLRWTIQELSRFLLCAIDIHVFG